jgi:RND family efflux transporter MFP subunit
MKISLNRFVLAMPLLVLTGCTARHAAPAAPPEVSGLATAKTEMVAIPSTTDAVGTVYAAESAVLSAQVSGRITAVLVHEGDVVRAGQPLLRLDDAQARAGVSRQDASVASSRHQVEAAQTESELASSTLARYQILRDRKSVSSQEFDEVSRRAQAAHAQLESVRSQLAAVEAATSEARTVAGYAGVTAPFAGTITARHVDPGVLATPGMPLLEISKAGPLQLRATVDESLLPAMRVGATISATLPALSSSPIEGRVADIVPAADPATHSFLIKVALPAMAGLHSGMYGTAAVATGTRNALLLPAAAVVAHGSLHSVWVVDENHIASLRYVTLGAPHGSWVEVLSGIGAGETVVLSPADRELAGVRVQP